MVGKGDMHTTIAAAGAICEHKLTQLLDVIVMLDTAEIAEVGLDDMSTAAAKLRIATMVNRSNMGKAFFERDTPMATSSTHRSKLEEDNKGCQMNK